MDFEPIRRIWEQRVDRAREESESLVFQELLSCGEMVTKIVASALVAAVENDRDNHRYKQIHRLVRADGVGEWAQVIDEVVGGSTSRFLLPEVRGLQRELNQGHRASDWQYESVALLHRCLRVLNLRSEDFPQKVLGRKWFSDFALLRNKTRGHGAPPSRRQEEVRPYLEESVRLLINNLSLFQYQWAHLHQKLSGSYRVTKLTPDATHFEYLRSDNAVNMPDGVYFYLRQPVRVELIKSDQDASDFFFPNGAWNDRQKRFELLSYITDERLEEAADPYLAPAGTWPASKTEGASILDDQGKTWGNLPPAPEPYVQRQTLEEMLYDELLKKDQHPIVTLVGRGGIGKTSLALSVLHKVAEREEYSAIIWFSARDVDLLPEGPKRVRQRVVTKKDIADHLVSLMEPSERVEKGFKALDYLSETLYKSPLTTDGDGALLFVFDNFETVRNPVDLFEYIDHYVRLPNKVLITTRFRDFKSDYPIEVPSMSRLEAERLIDATADTLGVRELLNEQYREKLYNESGGHPYVIKILLGEVKKARKLVPVPRIMEGKDRILDALFDLTFQGLSPAARRIYLTLCNWRSVVPQLAIEAAMLRSSEERVEVEEAVEELSSSSLVEVTESKKDGERFVTVPLAASLFGTRKLEVSPLRNKVEADSQLLRAFGAGKQTDIQRGIEPRIKRLFAYTANRPQELQSRLPMLEFVARRYPPAWRLLVSLHEESGAPDRWENAKMAVRQYLEFATSNDDREWAWDKLANLCQKTGDYSEEIDALVQRCQLRNASLRSMSYAAGRLLTVNSEQYEVWDKEEKEVVVHNLIGLMQSHMKEMHSSDLARLVYLYLIVDEKEQAREATELGLQKDPNNPHIRRAAERPFFAYR